MQFTPVAEFSERAEAEEAAAVLEEAGILWLIGEDDQYTLAVPEGDAHAAILLLAKSDEDEQALPFAAPPYQACPECGSFETKRLSDMPGTAIGLASMAAAAILYLKDLLGFAFAVIVLGFMIASVVSRHAGKYRCPRCGWTFLPR